jgi:hypothetical protein
MQLIPTRADHIQHRSRQLRAVQAWIDRQLEEFIHKGRDLRRRLALLRQRPQKIRLHRRLNGWIDQMRRCFCDLGVGEVRCGEKLVGERFHDLILNAAPCLATHELET